MLYLHFSLYFVLWALKNNTYFLLRVPLSLFCLQRSHVSQVLCWLLLTNAFPQPRAQLLVPSMAQWPGRYLDTTLPLPRHLLVDTDELPLWLLNFLLSLMLMEVHFILRIQVSFCFAGVQQQWSSFWRKLFEAVVLASDRQQLKPGYFMFSFALGNQSLNPAILRISAYHKNNCLSLSKKFRLNWVCLRTKI